jgi:hypothetical protein
VTTDTAAPKTELAVLDGGAFVALNHTSAEIGDYIRDALEGEDVTARDLVRLTVPSGKAQKYRWEVPTLDGGSEVVDEVAGIMVGYRSTRAFWPVKLDDVVGGRKPPACSSADYRFGFGKQWATKDDPSPAGEPVKLACAECPNSLFSDDNERPGCKSFGTLLLIGETGFLPRVISVPVTSMKAVRAFRLSLADGGVPPFAAVCAFGLAKATNAGGTDYALIAPRLTGRLDAAAAARAKAYGDMLRPVFERAAAPPEAQAVADEAATA